MDLKYSLGSLAILVFIVFNSCNVADKQPETYQEIVPGVRKIKDVMIYEDPKFYSAFPSVVRRDDGKLLVAFRRAPERKIYGEKGSSHVDPNSYLVMVSSMDGENWTKEPDHIYAHHFGGSQDPCLLQLRDGTLICTSYGWTYIRPDGVDSMKQRNIIPRTDGFVFLGGYFVRSSDGGKTWQGPFYPPRIPYETRVTPYDEPLPAYNRGALYEGKGGMIFWVVAGRDPLFPKTTSTYLYISDDKGDTWQYSGRVASDENVTFNETSVYETPKGDIVAFMRTGNLDGQAAIARSQDGGKTFDKWESMGFQGFPLHALRLPDNRVFLVYGYRYKPYGIRARILNAECTDFSTATEIVLRDDGGNGDIGYPWSVLLDRNRVLVTYYYNKENGIRHIAGTILEIN